MKKKSGLLIGLALLTNILPTIVSGQVATEVAFYILPASFPDVSKPEFGTARDNFLTTLCLGGPLDTESRVGKPTGVEVTDVFSTGDISVSSATNLWRAQFSPPAPYNLMSGQRGYGTVIMVGMNGKIWLDVTYKVTCGVGLLSNASSLLGLPYSVSRRGILRGPDGILFTPDDIVLKNGEPGTTLVDAIAFIGGRVGALVNNDDDISALNAEIGKNGTYATFTYWFGTTNSPAKGEASVAFHRSISIPARFSRLIGIPCPQGVLFSRVGPAGSPAAILQSSRQMPPISWKIEDTASVEGTSIFLYFTRNPTNDSGYARLLPPLLPPAAAASASSVRSQIVSASGNFAASNSTDIEQDSP